MSVQTLILARLDQVLALVNNMINNAKTNEELPTQAVLDLDSLLRVSRSGTSETITLDQIVAAAQNYEVLVENEYDDLAALLADQASQTSGKVQFVTDARTDAEVTAGDPVYFAYFEYLGTTNGIVTVDYRQLSSSEVLNYLTTQTFKTFTVRLNQEAATTLILNDHVDIQYENVANKVISILFDANYSKYLAGMNTLNSDGDFSIQIYNKTQQLFVGEYGVTFTLVNSLYYKVNLPQGNILNTLLAVGDVLTFDFNYYKPGAGGSSEPPVDEEYADITALITDQNAQLDDWFYKVNDASADATITTGGAIYRYLGTTLGTIVDYEKIWQETPEPITEEEIEGKIIFDASVTGTYNLDCNAASHWDLTLTGNTTLTTSNEPLTNKTKPFTLEVVSTPAETLTVPGGWRIIGEYKNDGSINYMSLLVNNVGGSPKITLYINQE